MLYIVPTPIGNIKDMTYRGVEVLKQSSLILCEDTRRTSILLKHYDIQTPCSPYHQNNEHTKTQFWIKRLAASDISLVCDAGTPCISDPGYILVRECIAQNISIECLPGASSIIPALVLSGFPVQPFVFYGFLPAQKKRQKSLLKLADFHRNKSTLILLVSPNRILKTLDDLCQTVGQENLVSVSKEITKKFESTERGSLREIFIKMKSISTLKGEFVIVIHPPQESNEIEN